MSDEEIPQDVRSPGEVAAWARERWPGFLDEEGERGGANTFAVIEIDLEDPIRSKYLFENAHGSRGIRNLSELSSDPDGVQSKLLRKFADRPEKIKNYHGATMGGHAGINNRIGQCDVSLNLDPGKRVSDLTQEGYALHEVVGHCGLGEVLDAGQHATLLGRIAKDVPYEEIRSWIGTDRHIDGYLDNLGVTEEIDSRGQIQAYDTLGEPMLEKNEQTSKLHIRADYFDRASAVPEMDTLSQGLYDYFDRPSGSRLPLTEEFDYTEGFIADGKVRMLVEEALLHHTLTSPEATREHEARIMDPVNEIQVPGPEAGREGVLNWSKEVFADIDRVYQDKLTPEEFSSRHRDGLGAHEPDKDPVKLIESVSEGGETNEIRRNLIDTVRDLAERKNASVLRQAFNEDMGKETGAGRSQGASGMEM